MKSELSDLESKLQSPEVWSNQNLASELGQKAKEIKDLFEKFTSWENVVADAETAYEIADDELIKESENSLIELEKQYGCKCT